MFCSSLAPAAILLQSQLIRGISLVFTAHIVLPFADRAGEPDHNSLSSSHRRNYTQICEKLPQWCFEPSSGIGPETSSLDAPPEAGLNDFELTSGIGPETSSLPKTRSTN